MTYRSANPDQLLLLPPCLGDLIDEKDLCRVISDFVDALPRARVEERFPHEAGRPAFHPRTMLKVILYAYTQKCYSSRRIARAIERDIHFMWLMAMERPSFNTVNRFRSLYLAEIVPQAFAALAQMLLEQGYIRAQDYFADGTVMEADAGKHTHVWRKSTERFKQRVQERAAAILAEVERINREEDADLGEVDLPEKGMASEIGAEDIERAARSLAESDDSEKRKAAKALKEEGEKLRKYEAQEETLGGRNSYSKTDPDATFMRTKDGLLAPAYNVQAGAQDGFITGVSVGQNGNDASGFIAHMEGRRNLGLAPAPTVMADAVYGTEENYAYLEEAGVESYLKYPAWHRESTGKLRPYEKASFTYNETEDTFTCPQGRTLVFVEEREVTTASGYVKRERIYECQSCSGCPAKESCTKSIGNRQIRHSPVLGRYQSQARARLCTDKGVELRKRRAPQIETVFAHIKHNMGIRRFHLRGLGKVRTEWIWIALSYNFRRLQSAAAS